MRCIAVAFFRGLRTAVALEDHPGPEDEGGEEGGGDGEDAGGGEGRGEDDERGDAPEEEEGGGDDPARGDSGDGAAGVFEGLGAAADFGLHPMCPGEFRGEDAHADGGEEPEAGAGKRGDEDAEEDEAGAGDEDPEAAGVSFEEIGCRGTFGDGDAEAGFEDAVDEQAAEKDEQREKHPK